MKQYVVDAFTDKVFKGNPAAICILDDWLPDEVMCNITIENNLSETAFAVKRGDRYHLRWFSLGGEVDLCGHATLACAYVLLNFDEKASNTVVFDTLSGELTVVRRDDLYEMDFPAFELMPVPVTEKITKAIGAQPREVYMGRDLLCVFDSEDDIKNITPNFDLVKKLDGLLLHVTAPGTELDCFSRTFAPKCNFPEDPVCGSGHCHIVPFWAERLNKESIIAFQASKRSGTLYCRMENNRVKIGGHAVLFSIADICFS